MPVDRLMRVLKTVSADAPRTALRTVEQKFCSYDAHISVRTSAGRQGWGERVVGEESEAGWGHAPCLRDANTSMLDWASRTAYVSLSCAGAAATKACPVALSPSVLDRFATAAMKRRPAALPKKSMVPFTLGMLPSKLMPVRLTP